METQFVYVTRYHSYSCNVIISECEVVNTPQRPVCKLLLTYLLKVCILITVAMPVWSVCQGPGSSLVNAMDTVAVLHTVIQRLKSELGVRTIRLLDLACGDMQWMSRFLDTRPDVNYTGYDIVDKLIVNHRQKFSDKSWTFERRDFVVDEMAVSQYDLILVRHVLMHLRHADVLSVLSKLSRAARTLPPCKDLHRAFQLPGT